MGMVKHAIHEIIDGCDTYEEAVSRVEEAGLGTDGEILQGMWDSIKEDDIPTLRQLYPNLYEKLVPLIEKLEDQKKQTDTVIEELRSLLTS